MATLELYYSFRSPYSYLAADRLADIARQYPVEIDFRPVRPLALREPDFFERGRKQFVPYLIKDVLRESQRLGIAFGLPDPDPIDMDLASGKVAPDQPIMDRLMALGVAAAEAGEGLVFAQAVGPVIWGGAKNWHEEDALRKTLADAGLDLDAFSAWGAANGERLQQIIEQNEAAQLEHHWGVPLMVLHGEPFFGQDRIDALVWRLEQSA